MEEITDEDPRRSSRTEPQEPNRTRAAATSRVGYGNPPVETRFQKGRSGNPKGRPRKMKPALRELFNGIAEEPVFVRRGTQTIKVSQLKATIMAIFEEALRKQDMKTLTTLIKLYEEWVPPPEPSVESLERQAGAIGAIVIGPETHKVIDELREYHDEMIRQYPQLVSGDEGD